MAEPDHHRIDIIVSSDDVDLVVDQIWLTDPLAVGEAETPDGRTHYTVGYADGEAARQAIDRLAPWDPTLGAVRHDSWVDTWRAEAKPQVAGPFRIRLPEHEPTPDGIDLVIEPGATFGFGHPSTLLALELLANIDVHGAEIADIGSGSGVLAIAAALSGATTVHAVDIAADAVAATVDNAGRNGVDVHAAAGSVDALPPGPFDLVLANVTAGTQAEILPALGSRLGSATTIILSGLLDGQQADAAALVPDHEIVDTRRLDGWVAVRLAVSRIASP